MPKSELVIVRDTPGQTEINSNITQAHDEYHDGFDDNNLEPIKSPEKSFKSMSWRERWEFTRELITVEPLIACYMIGITIPEAAYQNLQFEKSCRVDAGFDNLVCEAILAGNTETFPNETAEVHLNIANLNSWLIPITTIVPFILSLFWGSFSDRHQIRKPFLLLPMFGELLSAIGCIFSVVFMYSWNLSTFAILTGFVSSFLGGQVLLVVALFAYIADVSTLEQRTLRVAVGQIVIQVCRIIAQPLSGILFTILGYYGIFIIYIVVQIIGIFYGIFCMKEKLRPRNVENKKSLLLDLFDPRHLTEAFSVLLVKKNGNNRLHIVLIMIIFFIYSGVFTGEGTLTLLYVNSTFGFTTSMFSYLLTFNTLAHLKGNIIGVYLFTKIFKFTDYTIINITLIDKILSNIVIALAASRVMLYVGVYLSLLTGITIIAIRSIATKVVCQEDLGKAQSFFGICESIGGAAFAPIYSQLIYPNFVNTFPNGFFFAVIPFFGICILLVLWMHWDHYQSSTKTKTNKNLEGIENTAMVMNETQTTHI